MNRGILDMFTFPNIGDVFDPGEAIRQQTAIHGLLIAVGELEIDSEISGHDALLLAEKYIAEKFKEHGITE